LNTGWLVHLITPSTEACDQQIALRIASPVSPPAQNRRKPYQSSPEATESAENCVAAS
jgi:hypothetical protein